jgi:hypothetical protein
LTTELPTSIDFATIITNIHFTAKLLRPVNADYRQLFGRHFSAAVDYILICGKSLPDCNTGVIENCYVNDAAGVFR